MGHVYAIQQGNGNKIKIGAVRSDRPDAGQQRQKTHSTSNPERLTQIDRIDTPYPHVAEKVLKDEFRSRKIIDGGGTEWFDISPEEIHAAFEAMRRYMSEYEAEQPRVEKLKKTKSDAEARKASNEEVDTYWQIMRLYERAAKIERETERLERKLMLSIGSASGLEGLVAWETRMTRTLDQAAFRAAHPDLYEKFLRLVQSRPFKLR